MHETPDFIDEQHGYRVAPLAPARWDDFVTVLGRGGIGGCWCMYWIAPSGAAFRQGAKGGGKGANRDAFRRLVESGPPPGLLAYRDGLPVAWCRVMPRERLAGLAASRHFGTTLDIAGVWSLSCFVVRPGHRGRGLVSILTRAAAEFARRHGARHLEAYPRDTAERQTPGAVYMGVASTFARLGFEEVQRKAPHKPMMRLEL